MQQGQNWSDSFGSDIHLRMLELIVTAPEPLVPILKYQLAGAARTKGIRTAFMLACSEEIGHPLRYESLVTRGAVLQLFHEMTLMLDDLLDRSRYRRGQLAVHCKFGRIPALCAALWAKEVGAVLFRDVPEVLEALSTCAFELMDGETRQWFLRLGPRPIALEDWIKIASGDTGALFRLAARLAGRTSQDAIEEIYLLYHGLDDVHDILEVSALGGGGHADVRDKVPTLLSCFASGNQLEDLVAAVPAALMFLREVYVRSLEQASEPMQQILTSLEKMLISAEQASQRHPSLAAFAACGP